MTEETIMFCRAILDGKGRVMRRVIDGDGKPLTEWVNAQATGEDALPVIAKGTAAVVENRVGDQPDILAMAIDRPRGVVEGDTLYIQSLFSI